MKVSLWPLSTSRRCTSWPGNILRQQGVLSCSRFLPSASQGCGIFLTSTTHAMIWFKEQSLREVREICFRIYQENMALSPALLLIRSGPWEMPFKEFYWNCRHSQLLLQVGSCQQMLHFFHIKARGLYLRPNITITIIIIITMIIIMHSYLLIINLHESVLEVSLGHPIYCS